MYRPVLFGFTEMPFARKKGLISRFLKCLGHCLLVQRQIVDIFRGFELGRFGSLGGHIGDPVSNIDPYRIFTVMIAARIGEQTGEAAYASVNRTARLVSLSILGVS